MSVTSALLFLAVSGITACGSRNVDHFEDTWSKGSASYINGLVVTRCETCDQGSGIANSAGYTTQRTTIGGHYLRRRGTTSPSYQVSGGIHGNQRATK